MCVDPVSNGLDTLSRCKCSKYFAFYPNFNIKTTDTGRDRNINKSY